ncbi:MAG: redoxin domain-containing protein [Pseudobacter sp.]|uniref:redoxin domain-containing protein n=1 Tax=Pseudobacter sp. TaxID=2045420 RepID=UPI003F7FB484
MNNKIIFLTTFTLAGFSALAQSKPFTIDGSIKGGHNGYVYLSYSTGDRDHRTDSSLVKNGKFTFKGELPNPVMAMVSAEKLRSMSGREDYKQLFIEPGNMKLSLVKGNIRSATLTGSAANAENEELEKTNASLRAEMKPLSEAYEKRNLEYMAAMKAKKDENTLQQLKDKATEAKDKLDPYYEKMRANTMNWVKAHPESWATAYVMRFYVSSMKVEEGEELYAKMPPHIQQSSYGKAIKKELEGLRMGSPGSKAYGFTKTDINGQQLSLSDLKGKYVLVDFWASWCVPCRKGNPHLLSLYSKYKDKGFEIVGVSDDDSNHDAWKKAVAKDGIGVWKHVLRGLDMKKKMNDEDNPEDISDYYGIHSLPTKILINPEGVIVGRYGGGGEDDEAMDKKLKEIFGS